MNRSTKIAGLVAVAVAAAGCSDFLTGPGISQNPNQPITAGTPQLFIAAQAQAFVRQQGQLARTAGMLVQQVSGINNQQRDWVSRWQGTESDYSGQFAAFYTGGGLVDWRKIQAAANAAGDNQFEGIAKVWEAYQMGTAASIWGDIPYREAVGDVEKPQLDPQQQVYQDLQAVLDGAITLLGGAGPGPAGADLVYGGNTGRWVRAANTLKARYHLHTAERLGQPAYQAALAAALNGINEAPADVGQAVHGQAPGDFRALHGNSLENGNIWAQFLRARQDIVAGDKLVEILNARHAAGEADPRRAGYFLPNTDGNFVGATQLGVEAQGTASLISNVVAGSNRAAYAFRQPLITWSENQLIIAEAKYQLGDPTAIMHLNNVRTAVGLPALLGPITLQDIMIEKYIVMFQNIEAWNDFKRTCIPALVPPGNPQLAEVPGRVPYGLAERQNNPNVPLPSVFPEGTTGSSALRNWNDPNPCPVP
jgi:starch-binding outer membrane protein, SusD/RagB family